jgi:hypothetical protein
VLVVALASASAAAEPPPATSTTPPTAIPKPPRHDGPWLMVGGAIGFVVIGAVLQYSATSSEQDIRDLYLGEAGHTPVYNAATAASYHQLIDEGNRYADLAWVAFGVAAGFAAASSIWFVHDVHIAPLVTPTEGGLTLRTRF